MVQAKVIVISVFVFLYDTYQVSHKDFFDVLPFSRFKLINETNPKGERNL